MKVKTYSDTHGQHKFVEYPLPGLYDLMIHSGDLTTFGSADELWSVINFFGELVKDGIFKNVVFTAGNHDKFLQKADFRKEVEDNLPNGVIMLLDESVVINGIKIYGSPWTPEFSNWYFGYRREAEIARACWSQIPDDANIVITHGPPEGILDEVIDNKASNKKGEIVYKNLGCPWLMERILEVKPLVHVFGHIHYAYGHKDYQGISFFNSAQLNTYHTINNIPHEFEIIKCDDGTVIRIY